MLLIMKTFIVYLELYGKKMKVKKLAETAFEAHSKVKEDIKIHKIEESTNPIDMFNSIFGDVFTK